MADFIKMKHRRAEVVTHRRPYQHHQAAIDAVPNKLHPA